MVAATSANKTNSNSALVPRGHIAWDIYGCGIEQISARFGGGTPTPSIPRSQRQYDGDNQFEYCEIWSV